MEINQSMKITKAETERFGKIGSNFLKIGNTPNNGLECYLCESVLRSNYSDEFLQRQINKSIKRILTEAQYYNGKNFWGWEKKSSIPKVFFPLDWDDTSKAMDVLFLAINRNCFDVRKDFLPNNDLWRNEIKNSFFKCDTIGEDVKIKYKNGLSLSVFFGPMAEAWEKRDDPMVTVTTVRSTILWYSNVFSELRKDFIELIDKQIYLANYIIKYGIPFYKISRYYFSFGHYFYLLLQTLNLLGFDPLYFINNQIYSMVEKSISYLKNIREDIVLVNCEPFWWCLIGVEAKILTKSDIDFIDFSKYNFKDYYFIFRHRRLKHFYSSRAWLQRLLYWEYYRYKSAVSKKEYDYDLVIMESI